LAYGVVAAITVAVTSGVLVTTRVPSFVILSTASIVSTGILLYGHYYSAPVAFSVMAFAVLWCYAAAVSLAVVVLGRSMKLRFFLPKK
jgi:hypothetical protein